MKLQGVQEVSMKTSEWFLIWCICGREYFIKSFSRKRCFTIHPIRIFLSGSGGTEKSYLIKAIYQAVSKQLLYHAKDPEKPYVLLLRLTDIFKHPEYHVT